MLDGWRLVPVHPTKEMREAGAKINNQGWDFAHHTWNTMLLHAPSEPRMAIPMKRYCQCSSPDPEEGYCQNCGETWRCPHGIEDGACKQCYHNSSK